MIATIKTFSNGRSKAIRIPKAFELPDEELILVKVGDAIVVRPANNISSMSSTASVLADVFDHFERDSTPPRDIKL